MLRELAFIVAVLTAYGTAAADRPNVVVFFVDDMGWTDWQHDASLNPTGSVVYETPNMLRLAGDGVTFSQGYASAPVCSPTRASLLTGKTPARTGVTDFLGGGRNTSPTLQSPVWTLGTPASETTVAETFGSTAGGYDTGFIGKWHAGGSVTGQGFDSNVAGGGAGCPCDGEGGFFAGPDGRFGNMPGINVPGTYSPDTYLTDVLGGFAESFITAKAVDPDPFFLLMAPYQVHVPLQAPATTIDKYATKIADLQTQGVDLRGHDNAIYAAMVEEMDSALGRVLDRLEDPNGDGNNSDSIRNDTIVVFASDNGGLTISELGSDPATENAPLREGKGSLYEGGIRTPLIASWPGNPSIATGTTSNARVSTHDLYPTLVELAGLDGAPGLPLNANQDGVSFAAALEGGAHDRGYQYWHYPHESNQQARSGGTVTAGSFVSAVRNDTHKLIYFYETGQYELYDLINDLSETTDLFGADPALDFELTAALHAYLKRVGAAMPVRRANGLPVDLPTVAFLTIEGDFTGDGVINAADWSVLRGSFGLGLSPINASIAYTAGDVNLDGIVDRLDFAHFKQIYNQQNGPGSFEAMTAGLPEPTSVLIAAIAVGSFSTPRRSRCGSDAR